MAFEVRIPSLGESVSEGVIARWAHDEGAVVSPDDVLLELETDKASMEIPAERAGVLHIVRPAGETVAVGDVVATIDEAAAGSGKARPKAAKEPRAAEPPAAAAAPKPQPAAKPAPAESVPPPPV